MAYLAYISFLFLGMQFVNVVLNAIFRQKFKFSEVKNNERISVLIPARNEEKNIGLILSDLLNTKTTNLEIIVFDDESTDNTAKIVEDFAKQDKRIAFTTTSDDNRYEWVSRICL